MNRIAFGALCTAAGFAGGLTIFSAAHGENDTTAYRQLDLFSDAFERVRANYVRPVVVHVLIDSAIDGMISNFYPPSPHLPPNTSSPMPHTPPLDTLTS